ncbi:TRAP transporter substrate-binding protein [Malikia granosa]|uniref:ABC transporter substrate-binding protein n=1 Tax=Malikia granosa TaxID=263067 RepID=A0A2S9K7S4_9BURK|nr:TRAP transporter substrate-binding protein [Malikia granosa]PRD66464.1 ABC transporter substrate-binding protein [Malikia granosa]
MKLIKLSQVAAVAAALLLGSAANAQIEERTIRIGHPVNADHPISFGVKKFSDLVAARSGGKLKVREFPALQLGNEMQQLSALAGGVQEMFAPGTPPIAGMVKDFALLDLPFLVDTPEQADALLDGPFGQALLAKLPEKGLVGLAFWENGFRHVTNSKRPIKRLEDLEGLKIRVQQNPVFIETFKALKTNPVPMSFAELYGALESKALDAQENPYLITRSAKLNETQKYLSSTSHAYGVIAVLVSKKFWDKLSSEEQKILRSAAIEARDYERQVSRAQAKRAVDELTAGGMQFDAVPAAELARMRQATQGVVNRVLQTYDPTMVKLLQTELERVKKIK